MEASWLLTRAAETTGDALCIEKINQLCINMVNAASAGIDKADGALWRNYETNTGKWLREKHWWPQTEAAVAFFNAWQITSEKKYLRQSLQSWQFIRNHLIDKENGEWFFAVDDQYAVLPNEPKAGFWKCPYHNGRMCMEIINRINTSVSLPELVS